MRYHVGTHSIRSDTADWAMKWFWGENYLNFSFSNRLAETHYSTAANSRTKQNNEMQTFAILKIMKFAFHFMIGKIEMAKFDRQKLWVKWTKMMVVMVNSRVFSIKNMKQKP